MTVPETDHGDDYVDRGVDGAAPEHPTGWWKAVVERASDVLIALDDQGTITYMSPAGERVFGWESSTVIGTNGFHLVHTDDATRIQAAVERGLAGAEPQPYPTFRVRHQDGRWCHVEARASNLLALPEVGAFIISLRDVTEWVDAEAAIRLRDERYFAVVERSPEAILILQEDTVVHANPSALRLLLAADRAELVGVGISTIFRAEAGEVDLLEPAPVSDAPSPPADRLLGRLDGSVLPVEVTSIPTVWDGFAATQVIVRDVTEQRQADQRLVHLATHDPLTGLPNRNLLEDRLGHATARARRTRRPFAVLFLDLDRFKVINDSLGHEFGDDVLRQVAERLADAVRPGDTVARLGGDEFVIVVEDLLVADTVDLVVERVLGAFEEPVRVAGREFSVGASLGVLVTTDGSEPRSLLRDADTAMYTAKTTGRGRAVRFDAALREQVHRHEELERRLRAALDERQITTAMQPIVRLSDRRVMGIEVFMRWIHPERGLLLPESFLDVADESGLLPDLGHELLRLATKEATAWAARSGRRRSDSPWLSVNVAHSELVRSGFATQVLEVLSARGLAPHALYLELTEEALLDDPVGILDVLRPLRDAGVGIAIDDFGSGYTSLSALRRFAPDLIKVDSAYVGRITESPSDAAMVRAIIQMGHALGIPVAAEGVELVEQQHLLGVLGCDYAQGYLFARPGESAALEELLDT